MSDGGEEWDAFAQRVAFAIVLHLKWFGSVANESEKRYKQ